MNDLLQDIGFAWRNALKAPGTTLLIVITLALGIGTNTAMFSTAWHVLLAPLPYANGDGLVKLEQSMPAKDRYNTFWSLPTFTAYQGQNTVFSGMAGYTQHSLSLIVKQQPLMALTGVVSWNFFELLGIQPVVGRTFASADEVPGSEPVVLLSYENWVNNFNADPAVVGTTLEMHELLATVIGVLPALPPFPYGNDIWITQAANPYIIKLPQGQQSSLNGYWFGQVFARLREGLVLETAAREIDVIARRLEAADPDFYMEGYSVELKKIRDVMAGESGTTFMLLSSLALLVMLITSANVANLNLARVAARSQELAICEALGASAARISRQLLTESMLLAVAGGIGGLVLAGACLNLLRDFAEGYSPMASRISMDVSVLLLALFITALTGILSGLAPVFTKRDINRALKEGGDKVTTSSAGSKKRQLLLLIQFAFSFVILVTSALIMLSLHRLNQQDTGYDPDQVVAVSMLYHVDLDQDSQQFSGQIRNFAMNLMAQVKAVPGVVEAGLFGGRPLLQDSVYSPQQETFDVDDRAGSASGSSVFATVSLASGSWFDVLDIPLLSGRFFSAGDTENAPRVVLVNANFAENYFPGQDAVGQRIKTPFETDWATIIGVVGNIRAAALTREEEEAVYYNFEQSPGDVLNLYVRTTLAPAALRPIIIDIIHTLAPHQPVGSIRPLNEVKVGWLAPVRLRATLILLFGILALLVTLSGVVGAVSYNVSQRVREIGIHMAIGASPSKVVNMFVTEGLKIYLVGLLAGLALMVGAAALLEPLLYQTAALDAGIYLASAFVLTLTVLGAIWLPASKAGAMSPVAALHNQ